MKRKFLEDLGLEKETIDKIIDQNSQEIGGYKKKAEELEEKNKQLVDDVKTRDTQLSDLKKAGSVEDLKKQLDAAQEANKQAKKDYEEKVANMKYDAAIEKALSTSLHPELMSVKIDRAKLKIKEDGTIEGLDDQVNSLKETYKDMFKTVKSGKNPNEGNDHEKKPEEMSYEDFVKELEDSE